MRYDHAFPAREFLKRFPDDFARFLLRAEEMAEFGTISVKRHGHALKGRWADLYQFNMELTRSWGFRHRDAFIVLSAAKKRTSGQEPDYEFALKLREDFLNGVQDD